VGFFGEFARINLSTGQIVEKNPIPKMWDLIPKMWDLIPKMWDLIPKMWDLIPKMWDLSPKMWDLAKITLNIQRNYGTI